MGEKKLHENKLPRNVWTLGNDDFSNRSKNEYFVKFSHRFFVFSCFNTDNHRHLFTVF